MGTRNLESVDNIGHEGAIKAVRERHHRLSGSTKEGTNAGHAIYAGDGAGGDRGMWVEAAGENVVHERENTDNESGGGVATTAGGDDSSAEATETNFSPKGGLQVVARRATLLADSKGKLYSQCSGLGACC